MIALPSAFSMMRGCFPSIIATAELVVPDECQRNSFRSIESKITQIDTDDGTFDFLFSAIGIIPGKR